jgi:predicted RNA-binding Zn ribbon-like protein
MPPPIPPGLALVRDFVNTYDVDLKTDALDTPAALRTWLVERGLIEPACTVSASDHQALIEVREALRALMLANNGEPVVPQVRRVLDAHATRAPLLVHFHEDGGAGFDPADGGASDAIGRLLATVVGEMARGNWPRMKVCREHSCEWAFYDSSKNASRTWCNMQVCGNRAKARAFQQRRKAAVAG